MMLADFILHVDRHLREFVDAYGLWVYALLFLVIFVETGLVVMPFLPGDSLLFVVGALAGAVVARLWQCLGANRPRVVVVEPLTADAVYQSAARGKLSRTDGTLNTVMDGLSVGTASHLAWEILDGGAYGFLAIPDPPAVAAMRLAHQGPSSLVIGETGIAGLAGALVACSEESMRKSLGLGPESKVVAIACEGPTDLEVFHRLLDGAPA